MGIILTLIGMVISKVFLIHNHDIIAFFKYIIAVLWRWNSLFYFVFHAFPYILPNMIGTNYKNILPSLK